MPADEVSLSAIYPTMSQKPVELATPPANVAALREDRADLTKSYPTMAEQQYNSVHFVDDIETPPAQARAQRAELANLFNDVGASAQDAGYAQARVRQYAQTPPTAAEIAGMQREAKAQLSSIYGADAHQALNDAKKLATRDPRFAKLLATTNLGNDPGFIVRMAAMARAEKSRGRLK